jgi:hypothetical protein
MPGPRESLVRRISTDSHFWIPLAVLIAGIVLLLVVR